MKVTAGSQADVEEPGWTLHPSRLGSEGGHGGDVKLVCVMEELSSQLAQ